MSEMKGQCLCGQLKFELSEAIFKPVLCYCTICQRRTGSDRCLLLWVKKERLIFKEGKKATYTRVGDSGKPAIHHFCTECGTTVCVEVTAANIYSVNNAAFPWQPSFKPQLAIYTAFAPEWAQYPEGIPKFETLPDEYIALLKRQ